MSFGTSLPAHAEHHVSPVLTALPVQGWHMELPMFASSPFPHDIHPLLVSFGTSFPVHGVHTPAINASLSLHVVQTVPWVFGVVPLAHAEHAAPFILTSLPVHASHMELSELAS